MLETTSGIRSHSNDLELIASKREHIARCAAHIFAQKGYDRTSVQEVADACGMAIGALYRYIGKKEDIIDLVLDYGSAPFRKLYDDFERNLDSISPVEGIRQAVNGYYRKIDEFQDIVLLAYQEIRVLSPNARLSILDESKRCIAIFERLLMRGCETGEFRKHNVRHMAHMIVILGHMWAVRTWYLGKQYTLDKYIDETIELVLTSVTISKR
ncbi:MAG: TetR/AcrR family transcriptional regulator [Dehalococcoidia bacterium]